MKVEDSLEEVVVEVDVVSIVVEVDVSGNPGAPGQWTQVTQAEYDALSPPDPLILYVVIG